jgi:hypothetical protein
MSRQSVLSREQELFLIELGLKQLLSGRLRKVVRKKAQPQAETNNGEVKKGWTDQQRKKFRRTMKKIWAQKRAEAQAKEVSKK